MNFWISECLNVHEFLTAGIYDADESMLLNIRKDANLACVQSSPSVHISSFCMKLYNELYCIRIILTVALIHVFVVCQSNILNIVILSVS